MNVLEWATKAAPGEQIVYARREWHEKASSALLASALEAHSQSLVFLAQRHTDFGVAYEATRISKKTVDMLANRAGQMGERIWGRRG